VYRVLKFDPGETWGGGGFGTGHAKWQGGDLATDGVVYCGIPSCSTQILVIDPFKECSATLQTNMI
jgi:hypothetical protein